MGSAGSVTVLLILGMLASPASAWHIDAAGARGLSAPEAGVASPRMLSLSLDRPPVSPVSARVAAPIRVAPPGAERVTAQAVGQAVRQSGSPRVAYNRPPITKLDTRIHFGRFHPERLPVMALATTIALANDDRAMRAMHARIPESVRRSWPVRATSLIGGVGVPVAAGAMIFLGHGRLHDTGKMALTAVVVNAAVVTSLKILTGRQRPDGLDGAGGFHGPSLVYDSFPSGHASTAFALATVVGKRHREWKWWLYGGATLVAASRVLLDAHHPSDVLAGALIGIEVGNLVLKNEGAIARISIRF